jgi:hypothetical protein
LFPWQSRDSLDPIRLDWNRGPRFEGLPPLHTRLFRCGHAFRSELVAGINYRLITSDAWQSCCRARQRSGSALGSPTPKSVITFSKSVITALLKSFDGIGKAVELICLERELVRATAVEGLVLLFLPLHRAWGPFPCQTCLVSMLRICVTWRFLYLPSCLISTEV